jgi:hypothetical protein
MYTVGAASDYAIGVENAPPFTHNNSYALLTNLPANAGAITIHLDYFDGSTAPVISGLQLVTEASVIPEPASLSLLSIGAAGLIGFGWRRRKMAA